MVGWRDGCMVGEIREGRRGNAAVEKGEKKKKKRKEGWVSGAGDEVCSCRVCFWIRRGSQVS